MEDEDVLHDTESGGDSENNNTTASEPTHTHTYRHAIMQAMNCVGKQFLKK